MNNEQTSETIVKSIPIAVYQGYGASWIELPNGNTLWDTSLEHLSEALSTQGFGLDCSVMAKCFALICSLPNPD